MKEVTLDVGVDHTVTHTRELGGGSQEDKGHRMRREGQTEAGV